MKVRELFEAPSDKDSSFQKTLGKITQNAKTASAQVNAIYKYIQEILEYDFDKFKDGVDANPTNKSGEFAVTLLGHLIKAHDGARAKFGGLPEYKAADKIIDQIKDELNELHPIIKKNRDNLEDWMKKTDYYANRTKIQAEVTKVAIKFNRDNPFINSGKEREEHIEKRNKAAQDFLNKKYPGWKRTSRGELTHDEHQKLTDKSAMGLYRKGGPFPKIVALVKKYEKYAEAFTTFEVLIDFDDDAPKNQSNLDGLPDSPMVVMLFMNIQHHYNLDDEFHKEEEAWFKEQLEYIVSATPGADWDKIKAPNDLSTAPFAYRGEVDGLKEAHTLVNMVSKAINRLLKKRSNALTASLKFTSLHQPSWQGGK